MKDEQGADAPATRQIHHDYMPPAGFAAVAPGVFKASTVLFDNVAAMQSHDWLNRQAYSYGLHGTPTSFTLEARLATLEGGRHALLVPSGLAAIALVDQALLASGDTVLIPSNAYFPNKNLAAHELARWGIGHRFYDPMDAESLRAALGADVALVWIEPPGSVTLEFPDLRALVRTVRTHAPRAVVGLDNTWGCGLAFDAFDLDAGVTPALRPQAGLASPLAPQAGLALPLAPQPGLALPLAPQAGLALPLGVDLTIHALTKYPSGGADVMMGSVVTRAQPLYEQLALTHSRLGLGVGPNDVELVLRGLPTVALRYAAQDAAARRIAQWALGRKEFVRVLNPATPGSPGHEHWRAQCRAAAGLVTVEFDPAIAPERVDRFVDGLRLFGIGWSWAGPMSLAVPYRSGTARVPGAAYQGSLVRLAIGLEDVADLIGDLEAGLAEL